MREERILESDEGRAKGSALKVGLSPEVEGLISPYAIRGLKNGDWMIEIWDGRVKRPAQVIRTTEVGGKHLVWFVRQKVGHRPKVGQLRELLPDLAGPFEQKVLRDPKSLKSVLQLFSE